MPITTTDRPTEGGFPMKAVLPLIVALAASAAGPAQAQSQGVTKNEIVIGSIQDLSGPIAGFGKQVRLGMMLRVDEINEQGGINGRKLKLLVEDSAYDPKKAVLAAQKLVNQDKIFIMAGHIGTAQNNAAMPVQFEKNVINFFPITAAREMYEPLHRL
jgi:branched-chain amino acid transport system substrate-binding protein